MGSAPSSRPVWFAEFHACERVVDAQAWQACDAATAHRAWLRMLTPRLTGHALERAQLAHRFVMQGVLSQLPAHRERSAVRELETKLQRKRRMQTLMRAAKLCAATEKELQDLGVSVWVWKASKV